LIVAHIFLMTLAWVFVLPNGVMLSIARSRYTLPVQVLFLALNAVGVLLVRIYNESTPDLYPNNSHHKLGWYLTWIVGIQVLLGVVTACAGNIKNKKRGGFIPISTEAMAEHQRLHSETYRLSNDSGQGTERNTDSLRSQSISSTGEYDHLPQPIKNEQEQETKYSLFRDSKLYRFLSSKLPGMLSWQVLQVFRLAYNTIDRTILILAFVEFTTGIVTYSGLFIGDRIYSGAAHFVKGGVFFWFGILTLGRWAGCFAGIGWAWNVKPSLSNIPSAEFVESFLIFLYGSTNVFLEHIAAWGAAWSAQDLEHISITLLFFGGGLCGMLIESRRIRDLLSTKSQLQSSFQPGEQNIEAPKSYSVSMNPLPALVVILLGLIMSSHHQESVVSTMLHKQWGTLLVGAAFARGATYVVFYLAPPTSHLPGRPPTELITAFCLMAGGMIFMASARDVIASIELYEINAMFVFTVSMGIIAFLMAWILVVLTIKGWALRKENRLVFAYH